MIFGKNRWFFFLFTTILAASTAFLIFSIYQDSAIPPPDRTLQSEEEAVAPKEPEPETLTFEDSIARRSTAQDILLKYDFTPDEAYRLIQDTRDVYNLNRVRAGNRVTFVKYADGSFKSLKYEIDDEEYLTVDLEGGRYVAARHKYDYDTVVEEFYGEIENSLWDTLTSNGENPQLVVDLFEFLLWDVDFTTVQRGDSFKIIVEKMYLDDQFVKYGRIHAVQFTSGDKTFQAFLFKDPATHKDKYYDEKGKAVRKAFLKAPFRFDPRVTSRFSYSRYHPILHRRRPHLGVDYGAPTGTPVLASASGRVVFAGRNGGFGNMIKLRHPSGFTTSYAHLSRILVRVGQSIKQGEVIGKVGATGLATGPHLDYRIQHPRGRFLNPTRLVSLPSDEKPIDRKHWQGFVAARDVFLRHLASIPEHEPYLSRVVPAG